MGHAGLWGLQNRGLYLRSRGSHWKVFKNMCDGGGVQHRLIRPALLRLCHAKRKGLEGGLRASRETWKEASAVAQEISEWELSLGFQQWRLVDLRAI